VAELTGGRVLPTFEVGTGDAGLFAREYVDAAGNSRELLRSTSPLPLWDWLVPVLIALVLVDVAIRRIAWDRSMAIAARDVVRERVRNVTATTREDVDRQTLGALREARSRPKAEASRKFEADAGAATGDLSDLVGGAKAGATKAKPAARSKPSTPAAGGEGGMSSLMEAKRRARERLEEEK
jgi:hypothetical protein